MIHKRGPGLVLLFTLLIFGCVEDDDSSDPFSVEGMTLGNADLEGIWEGIEVGVTGDTWTYTIGRESIEVMCNEITGYKGKIYVNENVTPHQANFVITSTLVPFYIGKTSLGIYELDGNTLRLCAVEPGTPNRPNDFIPDNDGRRIFELVRK